MALSNVIDLPSAETGDLSAWLSTNLASADGVNQHTGNYCFDLGSDGYVQQDAVWTASTVTIRFWFNCTGAEASSRDLLTFQDVSGAIGSVRVREVGGTLTVSVLATGGTEQDVASGFALSTYHLVEAKYIQGSGSNATVEAKVNSGSTTASNDGTSTSAATRYRLSGTAADVGENLYVDDIIACDNSTYPGSGVQQALRPNADSGDAGESDWAGLAWTVWDDDPINDGTDVNSGGNAANQICELTTVTVSIINHVRIGARLHDEGGFTGPAYIRSKVSSSENSSDLTASLGTAYGYFTFDPSTQPSNQTELDGYQAGAASGDTKKSLFGSEVWVILDYTPSAASDIKKLAGVLQASLKEVAGVAEASINKVAGVVN